MSSGLKDVLRDHESFKQELASKSHQSQSQAKQGHLAKKASEDSDEIPFILDQPDRDFTERESTARDRIPEKLGEKPKNPETLSKKPKTRQPDQTPFQKKST